MVQYFDAHYETWGTRAVTPPDSTNTASVEHVLYIPTPEGSIIFFQQGVFVKPHMPQWGWGGPPGSPGQCHKVAKSNYI